jgi:NTP pyrophosphatase (non-canonical NTP hydrolase)
MPDHPPNADYVPTQAETLTFVKERWPHMADAQSRLNKMGEEYGEIVGAFVKMRDNTGRKTLVDLAQETAQLAICVMAFAEANGFDLRREVAEEWERATHRQWVGTPAPIGREQADA